MVDEVLELPVDTKAMILAPVVRDRKGEYSNLLKKLQSEGFVRVRIDGDIYELDHVPELALRKKHTIEVIVDRFKIRPELSTRLSESFETALKLSEGLVTVSAMDNDFEDLVFSSRFACSECGYSLKELEPRLFSFNNPQGACEACDGLGIAQFFDEQRIIHDAKLSINQGAIRGLDKKKRLLCQFIRSLSSAFFISLDTPFANLERAIKDIILYGSDEHISFTYHRASGRSFKRSHTFEGIIPNMQRRYKESESDIVREELAKYLSHQPCEVCNGGRLNEAAAMYLSITLICQL